LTSEQIKAEIQALLREREGYVRYGRDEKVKQVDAALEAFGHRAKTPAKRATKLTPKPRTEL
jgi:hypothetical protein